MVGKQLLQYIVYVFPLAFAVHEECELQVSCDKPFYSSSDKTMTVSVLGPIGEPGENGEKGPPGEKGSKGLIGNPGIPAPAPPGVAFFVGLTFNTKKSDGGNIVKFDRVLANTVRAYNPTNGKFISPYTGIYKFSVTVSAKGKFRAAVDLMRNGRLIIPIWVESIPNWSMASNSAILTLKENDEIYVKLRKDQWHLHGYMYTTFSGHMIYGQAVLNETSKYNP